MGELFIFARFHARRGKEGAVATALEEVVGPTRGEPGCIEIDSYHSIRDPRLFYIHSWWTDEAAFEDHVKQPHTVRFDENIRGLIDHPMDVARTRALGLGRIGGRSQA